MWVNSVVSSVLLALPLFTQSETFRCVASSDAWGQLQTFGTAQNLPNYFVRIGRAGAAGGAGQWIVTPPCSPRQLHSPICPL